MMQWQPSGWPPAGAAGGANAPTQPSFETYERDLFARVASIAGLDIARDIIEGKGLREWEARERAETAINAVVHLAECYIPGHTEFGAQQVRETIREDTVAALRSLQQRMKHTGVLRSLQQRMKQT
ncbi:hypothetical protein JKP88DRAFT_289452 [Tribonema minus]|uniref:Uncharacterized protein n=1 Tax=Tribonema minus TaxID=303371 RepID=A0A835Z2C4_9STRA|nr:hypothetical protein JKP88DRAFT_289452 [Tribonema minus]